MAPSDPPPVPPSHAPRATSYREDDQTIIPITNEPAPVRTLQRNGSSSQGVQRKKSLVRPERERIDPNHRQYHYRQRAAEHASRDGPVSSSTTGNAPIYAGGSQAVGLSTAIQVPPHGPPPPPPPPQRHRSLRDRVVPVRRGKSILGREEPDVSKDRTPHHLPPTPIQPQTPVPSPPEPVPNTFKKKPLPNDYDGKDRRNWPSCWYAYSLFISCWIPNFMLRAFGKLMIKKFFFIYIFYFGAMRLDMVRSSEKHNVTLNSQPPTISTPKSLIALPQKLIPKKNNLLNDEHVGYILHVIKNINNRTRNLPEHPL